MQNPQHESVDQVILVDEQDTPIGVMDKIDAHRGEGVLHRAISVYLFNKKGELLLQQRSGKKIVGAGQWANTCCGNVRPNESYKECAVRRLREELGITEVKIEPIYKFQYFVRCNEEFSEREIDQVFVGKYQGEVEPNPEEVRKVKWVEFKPALLKQQFELAPWFIQAIEKPELLEVINI
jgi:isopentenyl-diphosphate delta-isomerase